MLHQFPGIRFITFCERRAWTTCVATRSKHTSYCCCCARASDCNFLLACSSVRHRSASICTTDSLLIRASLWYWNSSDGTCAKKERLNTSSLTWGAMCHQFNHVAVNQIRFYINQKRISVSQIHTQKTQYKGWGGAKYGTPTMKCYTQHIYDDRLLTNLIINATSHITIHCQRTVTEEWENKVYPLITSMKFSSRSITRKTQNNTVYAMIYQVIILRVPLGTTRIISGVEHKDWPMMKDPSTDLCVLDGGVLFNNCRIALVKRCNGGLVLL